jgi:putative Mg2+ transporter-C (MgtC) family protein
MNYDFFPAFLTDNYFIRLLVAAVLGAVIGFERDRHGRSAGLRTNLLVSLGAALFFVVANKIVAALDPAGIVRADPGRIPAQIVTGIGFVGAGAIIKEGLSIRGLTTAACLWLVAGIGMAAGAGYFEIAIFVTALGLVSLIGLRYLEELFAHESYHNLDIITRNTVNVTDLVPLVDRAKLHVVNCDYTRNYETGIMQISFSVHVLHKGKTDVLSNQVIDDIKNSGIPVTAITWKHQ